MTKRNLKYLKDVPWLDLVEEAWVEKFEKKMDEWLEKLVPIHKIGKAMKAEFINFGDDCMVEPDVKYAFDSDSDIDNMFENDGIVYSFADSETWDIAYANYTPQIIEIMYNAIVNKE